MAAKRTATTELNHENWDREDDQPKEERGAFRTASENELKNRVIKKARRQVVADRKTSDEDNTDGAPKSVFSGFAGFGKPAAISSASAAQSPFSFLSKVAPAATGSSGASFSFGGAATSPAIPTATTSPAPSLSTATTSTAKSSNASPAGEKGAAHTNYHGKLKALNQAVSEWIKTHVDKNPLCILTPIFKDYENHLKELDEEKEKEKNGKPGTTAAASSGTTTAPLSGFKFSTGSAGPAASFSFGSAASKSSAATTQGNIFGGSSDSAAAGISPPKSSTSAGTGNKSNGFSFGLKAPATEGQPSFVFGKPTATAGDANPAGFSFSAGSAPFSFGNIQPPAASSNAKDGAADDDAEDQPPKVEFKQVMEEDSVYSKKCKVFVKKDNNFVDRGVGTLHLKPVKDSEKTQLIVRADTNLGNILVNLILSAGLPTQRMGKNNVMMVCLPTPDEEKPTSMLLRVKTGEEADELLATIEKYKK